MEPNKEIVYTSLKQCSQATGIPISVLKAAKYHPIQTGFTPGGRIYWDKAKPFIDAHMAELQEGADDSLVRWRTKKTKAEAFLAEIELEEAKKKYLLKEEVEANIKAIALAQKNILKTKLCNELPSRLLGMDAVAMSVELEKCLNEICKLMEDLKL